MAKATIVKISSIGKNRIGVWWNDKPFSATSFRGYNDNLKVTTPSDIVTLQEFAEFIVGCFESRSTFYGVASVTFTFKNVTVTVHKEDAKDNPNYVMEKWEQAQAAKNFSAYLNEDIDS